MEENKTYRRKCYFDENNYLIKYSMQLDGEDEFDLTIDILHSQRLNCYKKVNNELIYDTAKEQSQIAEEERLGEIADLKQKLKDSDYIWNVIKEGDATEEYYAVKIAERHAWRLRIRELEGE